MDNTELDNVKRELETQLTSIKKDLQNVKSTNTRIQNYVSRSEELMANLLKIEESYIQIKSEEGHVLSLKDKSAEYLETITQNSENVQLKIKEIETAYQSFKDINEKIINPETGLAVTFERVKGFEAEITNFRNQSDLFVESIKQNLSTIQEKIVEMSRVFEEFTIVNLKINNPESGLDAIFKESKELRSEIESTKETAETIFKEISKLKETAVSYVVDLKKIVKTANLSLDIIKIKEQESSNLRDEISKIFNISSRTAHANYFDERKKFLLNTTIVWIAISLVAIIGVVFLGWLFVFPIVDGIVKSDSTNIDKIVIESLIIRVGIISPLIFFLGYSLNQYSKERGLHEKYAFKSISMLSIESSIDLLLRALKDSKDINKRDNLILSFVIDTMKQIYENPVDKMNNSLILKVGNKLLEGSAQMTEKLDNLTEITQSK